MSRFHDEFFGKTETRHDELVMKCVSEDGRAKIIDSVDANTWVLKLPPDERKNLRIDYESEVICQSHGYKSNFIMGYADIIIKIKNSDKPEYDEEDAKVRVDKLINDFRVPRAEAERSVRRYYSRAGIDECSLVKILVECKPELADVGTTVRQIKTYESILRNEHDKIKWYKTIATYSTVPKETVDYLQHEGIHVVQF